MPTRSSLLALALLIAPALPAQSPLTTLNALQGFVWPGVATPNVFFDLVVTSTVTIQALDVNLDRNGSPAGAGGTIDIWTKPGSYVGFVTTPSAWTLGASGACTSGASQPTRVCLGAGVTLQPGNYGIAIQYHDLRPLFTQGTSTTTPGGTGPGTNQYYQNAHLTLLAGATQSQAFTSFAFAPYVWNGSIHYQLGVAQHTCATSQPFGDGCYAVFGSFYQRFASSGAASSSLPSRTLSLLFNGIGYTVTPAFPVGFVAPSAAAMQLPATDDGYNPVQLTTALSFPGGTTQNLVINSNAYVCADQPLPAAVTPNPFTPNVAGLLDAPFATWWSWHDYNPQEAGSGQITFEEVGPLAIVTWLDVESYPMTVVNRSTLQIQFDTSTGNVHFVWGSITPIGGSVYSDEHIIGFSPGGASPNPGPIDLATLTSLVLSPTEQFALEVSASPLPRLGSVVNLLTSRAPGVSVGINFLSLASLPAPGVSLAVLGMPGCSAHVDITQGVGNVIGTPPAFSMNVALPIPNQTGLLGLQIYSQSVWLDATANPFGAITSNAVALRIGNV